MMKINTKLSYRDLLSASNIFLKKGFAYIHLNIHQKDFSVIGVINESKDLLKDIIKIHVYDIQKKENIIFILCKKSKKILSTKRW